MKFEDQVHLRRSLILLKNTKAIVHLSRRVLFVLGSNKLLLSTIAHKHLVVCRSSESIWNCANAWCNKWNTTPRKLKVKINDEKIEKIRKYWFRSVNCSTFVEIVKRSVLSQVQRNYRQIINCKSDKEWTRSEI